MNIEDKQRLPYPYNQDLSDVVRRVSGTTQLSRRAKANRPETAAYLIAGMRLLTHHLGPDVERSPADPHNPDSIARPLLKVLSQRVVADEVANNPEPFMRLGTTGQFRATWTSTSDYVADLLRFGLWSLHYLGADAEAVAGQEDRLTDGTDLAGAIHAVAHQVLKARINLPAFRLRLLLAAVAEGDDVIREAITDNYREMTSIWRLTYNEVLRDHGLRPRPGLSADDMIYIAAACAEGLALRGIADQGTAVIDDTRQQSLLGKLAIALFLTCERSDHTAGMTIEETLATMVKFDPSASK